MSEKSQKTETDHGMRRLLRHAPGTVGGATGSAIGLGLGAIAVPGGEAIGAVVGSAAGNLLTGLGQEIWEPSSEPSRKTAPRYRAWRDGYRNPSAA